MPRNKEERFYALFIWFAGAYQPHSELWAGPVRQAQARYRALMHAMTVKGIQFKLKPVRIQPYKQLGEIVWGSTT